MALAGTQHATVTNMNLILVDPSEVRPQHAPDDEGDEGDDAGINAQVVADHVGNNNEALSGRDRGAVAPTKGGAVNGANKKMKRDESADGASSPTTTATASSSLLGSAVCVTVHLAGKDPRARHIVNHLKKRPGDTVLVGILNGPKHRARIVRIGAKDDDVRGSSSVDDTDNNHGHVSVTLTLIAPADQETTTRTSRPLSPYPSATTVSITLVLAVPFPMRLKYLWPVVGSMGVVCRIVVVRGRLSDPDHAKSRAVQDPAFFRPLLQEGLSQGGHTRMPDVAVDVEEPVSLAVLERLDLVWGAADASDTAPPNDGDDPSSFTARIFLDCGDETETPPSVRDVVWRQVQQQQQQQRRQQQNERNTLGADDAAGVAERFAPAACRRPSSVSAVIAVGPERGWTDSEAALFADAGFRPALLGPSVLRVDTAVVAGIAATQSALQEVVALSSSSSSSSWA